MVQQKHPRKTHGRKRQNRNPNQDQFQKEGPTKNNRLNTSQNRPSKIPKDRPKKRLNTPKSYPKPKLCGEAKNTAKTLGQKKDQCKKHGPDNTSIIYLLTKDGKHTHTHPRKHKVVAYFYVAYISKDHLENT